MENKFKVYYLIDPRYPNIIRYVGITSKDLKNRLYEHVKCAKRGRKLYVSDWIRNILNENIKPEILLLEDNINKDDIFNKEQYWINIYLSDSLTNLTKGGEGCFRYKHSEKTRQKISASLNGKSPWNKGLIGLQKHSLNTKQRMSISQKERYLRGVTNGLFKEIYQYDYLTGVLIKIWPSLNSIRKQHNYTLELISKNCKLIKNNKNELIAYKGFIWSYKEIKNISDYINTNGFIL